MMNVEALSRKLDRICRVCLQDCCDTQNKSIFSELENYEDFNEEIFFVYEIVCAAGSLEVRKGDNYPTLICLACFQEAETAYKFKLKCQNSKNILEECLKFKDKCNLISNVTNESDKLQVEVSDLRTKNSRFINKECKEINVSLRNNLKLDSELLNVCEIETETDNADCVSSTAKSKKHLVDRHYASPKIKEILLGGDNEDQEIPKKCPECNHVFKSVTTYNKHACVVAKTEGRKLCPVCGKSLSHSYFKSHLRTHTTQRTYICKICNKIYNSSCSLKFHMFKHSGEKPYLCSLCGKRFIQPTALKYHMRFHNNDRRYSCNYCEKTFVIQSHKVAHERTHTGTKPFTCEICGKSFTRKVELNSHLNRHNDNMPFTCRYCGKRFIKKTHLNLHEMIHSGKRPHECQFCGKGFIQRSPMLQHIKMQHSNKQT